MWYGPKQPEHGLKRTCSSWQGSFVRMNHRRRMFAWLSMFSEEQNMIAVKKQMVALFVDKSSQQWVVRDADGNFWLLPTGENPWGHRQSFDPTEESDLEPISGHYKYLLDLPF